jgi:integrase
LVDTLRALVEPMRKDDPGDMRDRALLCLGFASGCRRSELVALDIGDLSFGDDGLKITIRARLKRSPGGREMRTSREEWRSARRNFSHARALSSCGPGPLVPGPDLDDWRCRFAFGTVRHTIPSSASKRHAHRKTDLWLIELVTEFRVGDRLIPRHVGEERQMDPGPLPFAGEVLGRRHFGAPNPNLPNRG